MAEFLPEFVGFEGAEAVEELGDAEVDPFVVDGEEAVAEAEVAVDGDVYLQDSEGDVQVEETVVYEDATADAYTGDAMEVEDPAAGEVVYEEAVVEEAVAEEAIVYEEAVAEEVVAEEAVEEVAVEATEVMDIVEEAEVPVAAEEEQVMETEVTEEAPAEEVQEEVLDVDEAGMAADAAADALAVQESVAEEPATPVVPPSKGKVAGKGKVVGKGLALAKAPGKGGLNGKGAANGKGAEKGVAKGIVKATPLGVEKGKGKEKGKDKGKDKGKGKGKGKEGKEGGKGKGKEGKEGQGGPTLPTTGDTFYGLIYTAGAKTGNMLIRSWKASEKFGQEVMVPGKLNPAGVVVGDKISFEIMQGKEGGRPVAVNVCKRGHIEQIEHRPKEGSPEDIKRQILYYFSDENLRQDKFFQNIIATTEGGWISLAVILGCPRMQRMGTNPAAVFEACRGAPDLEFRETPGDEAIRRTTPPPLLEGGDASPSAGSAASAGAAPVAAAPTADDLFYAGMVKPKRAAGFKFFVQCEAVSEAFGGKDAWFDAKQKPQDVEPGSLVVFTLPPDVDAGFAPRASFVARLAPVGSLGQTAGTAGEGVGAAMAREGGKGQEGGKGKEGGKGQDSGKGKDKGRGKGYGGDVSRGPGVQRSIFKRPTPPARPPWQKQG